MDLMWGKFAQFIHKIADWLEAFGFAMSIVTVIKVFFLNKEVRRINDKHLFQVRITDHINDLKNSSKTISENISNFPTGVRVMQLEISKCIEHCNSIKKKVPSNELSNLNPLLNKMKKLRDKKADVNARFTKFQLLFVQKPKESDFSDVYIYLNSLITEIEHYNKDLKKALK